MKIVPYASLVIKLLRVATLVAPGVVGVVANETFNQVKHHLSLMERICKASDEVAGGIQQADYRHDFPSDSHGMISAAEVMGLRAFHRLLDDVGWQSNAETLRQVIDKATGDTLWVCPEHYKIYDPGLPILPEQI